MGQIGPAIKRYDIPEPQVVPLTVPEEWKNVPVTTPAKEAPVKTPEMEPVPA